MPPMASAPSECAATPRQRILRAAAFQRITEPQRSVAPAAGDSPAGPRRARMLLTPSFRRASYRTVGREPAARGRTGDIQLVSSRSAVVVDGDLAARGSRLAGQDPSLLDL